MKGGSFDFRRIHSKIFQINDAFSAIRREIKWNGKSETSSHLSIRIDICDVSGRARGRETEVIALFHRREVVEIAWNSIYVIPAVRWG